MSLLGNRLLYETFGLQGLLDFRPTAYAPTVAVEDRPGAELDTHETGPVQDGEQVSVGYSEPVADEKSPGANLVTEVLETESK